MTDRRLDESIGQARWWDDTTATLPDFTQAFAWSKALSEMHGKRNLWVAAARRADRPSVSDVRP